MLPIFCLAQTSLQVSSRENIKTGFGSVIDSVTTQKGFSRGIHTVEIDTLLTPEIGGIKQAIEIKTDNSDRPILLFLAGGPGSSMMNNADRFTNILKIDLPLFNGTKEMQEKH
jgi:hypothetical protein